MKEHFAQLQSELSKQIAAQFDELGRKLDARFDERDRTMDARFDERDRTMDARFDERDRTMDARFDERDRAMDARFDERDRNMDARFGELRKRLDERFNVLGNGLDERFRVSEQRLLSAIAQDVATQLETAETHLSGQMQVHAEELKDLVKKGAEGYGGTLEAIERRLETLSTKWDTKVGDHDLVLRAHAGRLDKLEGR